MKNLSTALCALSLIGATLLFGCKPTNQKTTVGATTITAPTAPTGRIAYVDMDSLEANYVYLKTTKDEFKKRQDEMEAELQRSYQQMQSDAAEVQKKAQANTLSETEYNAAQKRLSQMQQSLEARKQSLTDQLMKDQDEFNRDLKSRLDSYLAEYNKDKHFDYILSYTSQGGGSILLANPSLNITNDIIKGMNERSKGEVKKK